MALHLIKLCVGVDQVETLEAYWRGVADRVVHTRQTPKRAEELLQGGSLYWVIKGQVLCRQPILAVQSRGEGKETRCEIVVGLPIIRTFSLPRRPFQGWRYLTSADAPDDLTPGGQGSAPPDLAQRLRELGAW